jgi:hypothetical protein
MLGSGRIYGLKFMMKSLSENESNPRHSLSFQVTAQGSHADPDERDRITLYGGLGIPSKTTRLEFPTWKPHPGYK